MSKYKYIEKCIEGIVQQIGNHDLELIWYDDRSIDATVERGRAKLSQTNIIQKLIRPKTNRFSKKIATRIDRYEQCSGDYICLLEGDDFWINAEKIQMQIEAIEQTGCEICFSTAAIVDQDQKFLPELLADHGDKITVFSPQQIVDGDGGFMPTGSIVVKRSALERLPNWYFGYLPAGDYPLQVICGAQTGAVYLPQRTLAYRKHPEQWSAEYERNPTSSKRTIFLLEFIESLVKLAGENQLQHLDFRNIIHKYYEQLMLGSPEEEFVIEKQIASVLVAPLFRN